MELHDFRMYQPGDDLRQVDWNAVARTGEMILRVRQDEVSPRLEVVVDASRSVALSPAKEARARELALLAVEVGAQQGLTPTLLTTSTRPERAQGPVCRSALRAAAFDARDDLAAALGRIPPLRPCGLRVVVSDFLFEADLSSLVARLSRGASALFLVQVLERGRGWWTPRAARRWRSCSPTTCWPRTPGASRSTNARCARRRRGPGPR
jgi:uncharacterized protein (DUF58 family)